MGGVAFAREGTPSERLLKRVRALDAGDVQRLKEDAAQDDFAAVVRAVSA
jgi:hypothetical protein